MRQIERELQEVIGNQTITRVDTNLQPAATANSTMQIICTILATAVGMMIAFTMMLLSRQEGGYSGPELTGKGRSERPDKVEEMEPYKPRGTQELAEIDTATMHCHHNSGVHTHVPDQFSQYGQHGGYKEPHIAGKGRIGNLPFSCGGGTDEDTITTPLDSI